MIYVFVGCICFCEHFHQVGDGTFTHRTTPVDVTGLSGRVIVLALGGVRLSKQFCLHLVCLSNCVTLFLTC